ncbi:MAG TPA: nitrate- and nitrite sensing domain-containing protein, partial [Micromonosporaceae bacterium]|nr:nitrate- and nitrite sensing domain-containing protein [Micromonosporaceae bacterium]
MLARLGIRQKLALLLTIPLAALLLVMAPFTAERIRDAQSAQATSRIALAAREVGALIQALQHERLLAMGYLSSPNLDRSALVAQSELASDTAARLAADPLTADVMARAENELTALVGLRQFVVSRAVGARRAYEQYGAATTALLDALRLAQPPGADPEGLAQLAALDALMRSNEEVTGTGATLVALAGGLDVDRSELTTTLVRQRVHIAAFGQLVTPEQAGFVDSVDSGQAGVRFYDLVAQTQQSVDDPPVEVSEALTAALSYTGLRRLAQDRTAREIAIAAEQRASAAVSAAVGAVGGAVLVFAVALALGITVSRSISRPLRRLTRSAAIVSDVAHSELLRVTDSDSPETVPPPRLAAIEVDSRDEIGELAAALNRVQATAAMLIERQITARANIAVMFANIARRTQNLVGRQLALIDDLERNERNPAMLQRLFRLDHVATRLRRSADSLLVVSGTIDQVISGGPTPLIDVIRSAVAEIEGYRAV